MIEHGHPQVSIVRQCELLKLSRSSVYYVPREQCQEDLDLMYLIDQQHLETPYYGSRKMRVHLERKGHLINRKRVQRLMRTMGIQAVYPRPRTSIPGDGHKVYPYLLKGLKIDRPNQVWATDISYVPLARGFMYLVAIIDWYSRILIKVPSSPVRPSQALSRSMAFGSAWTARAAIMTTSSWNGSGAASSTSASTSQPSRMDAT